MNLPNTNKPFFVGNKKATQNVKAQLCIFCSKTVNEEDFKDKLSKREYEISGFCQACQDKNDEYCKKLEDMGEE